MIVAQRYRTITDGLRAAAVDNVVQLLPHTVSVAEAVRLVADQFEVSENSVRNWLRRADIDTSEHTIDRRLADANAQLAVLTAMNRTLVEGFSTEVGG